MLKNRMIDVQVSNNKLYFRAIGIVAMFAGVDDERARLALLKAIYDVNTVTEEVR